MQVREWYREWPDLQRAHIKELADVLIIDDFLSLPDIKAASMNTVTAIIHLKMTNIIEIIETAQIASYHGLLPKLFQVDSLIQAGI